MVSRTCWPVICNSRMMVLLMAVVALWATSAIAGVNEDLWQAAKRGDLPEIKSLLDKGAEVNAKNDNGSTALMAASLQGHPEIVQALLAKGAEVNAKNNNGSTALMAACLQGHREIVEALLAKGAEVNVKNNNGSTALMAASSN